MRRMRRGCWTIFGDTQKNSREINKGYGSGKEEIGIGLEELDVGGGELGVEGDKEERVREKANDPRKPW